jgi:hypothetical protein
MEKCVACECLLREKEKELCYSCDNDATASALDQWCEMLEHKTKDRTYYWKSGRKYAKVIQVWGSDRSESVHAFLDLDTKLVLKPASWKKPSKTSNYHLYNDCNELWQECDGNGAYLYNNARKKSKC